MYIPKHYKNENIEEAIEFMNCYSFGTLVTSVADKPIATHLPFVISQREGKIVITSHFSKGNEQVADFSSKQALAIFSEPHAYVSPAFYEEELNVPTWNYLSVHAYGKATIIDEEEAVFNVLEQMIRTFEAKYMHQWEGLPLEYRTKMAQSIVAFEIVVDELQFKEKLSQNKTEVERNRIIQSFARSADPNKNIVADYMSKKERD
jgi:transcriptional regulator